MHHVNFLQPHQRGVQHFSLPEYSENSGKCISITLSTHVETVVLLSKGEVDSKKIRVEFSLEDMDMSEFQDGATYTQIKDYVLEHSGLKVSNLYISQIKRKCGGRVVRTIICRSPRIPDSHSAHWKKRKQSEKHSNILG